jgi:hypothetical protein
MIKMRFMVTGAKLNAPPAPASKPYQPVVVTLPPAASDERLDAFRNELAVVARGRVYAELARLVIGQGFFWDRDFNGSFNGQQPAVDNLATAVRLEFRDGTGWERLEKFAAEGTTSPLTGRPGVVCAPGELAFDSVEFDMLLDATRSQARDWAFPRADAIAVRAAAQNSAPVIDTLGMALVRAFGSLAKSDEAMPARAVWTRVATPTGKIGFVAPGTLMPFQAARLCYGKDGFGRWRIAGFVGGD